MLQLDVQHLLLQKQFLIVKPAKPPYSVNERKNILLTAQRAFASSNTIDLLTIALCHSRELIMLASFKSDQYFLLVWFYKFEKDGPFILKPNQNICTAPRFICFF